MYTHIKFLLDSALEHDQRAAYEESRGSSGCAFRNKAEMSRRAAQALKLEQETGTAHCVCCLKPFKGHSSLVNKAFEEAK